MISHLDLHPIRPFRAPFAPAFMQPAPARESVLIEVAEAQAARFERAQAIVARDLRIGRERRAKGARIRRELRRMVAAGDRIARLPYVYGGGHGSFTASGYDCSGSVSYVLHAAGLLSTPEDSGQLMSYGVPGPGRHVTIFANGGHAWMTIDGRRFDTIAFQETGDRWSRTTGSSAGYVEVHPRGL